MKEFTDAELFAMFNVDCDPNRTVDSCVIRMPLLKVRVRKAKVSTRVKHTCDRIKEGVTVHSPGKDRVADLVKFYAANAVNEISPFEV